MPIPPHSELFSLLRAIASGDTATALRLLNVSPHLATEAAQIGATRATAKAYFVDAVGRYILAGDTALHFAAAAYRADIARELVARGANPRAANRRGAEPLHGAVVGQPGSRHWNPTAQAEVIEYLIREGADPNGMDKSGVAPLHRAVRSRCAAAVRILLAHDADPRKKNRSGSTPLHLAVQTTGRGGSGTVPARQQQAEIVRLLVEHGARMTDRDGRGKTVADRARNFPPAGRVGTR